MTTPHVVTPLAEAIDEAAGMPPERTPAGRARLFTQFCQILVRIVLSLVYDPLRKLVDEVLSERSHRDREALKQELRQELLDELGQLIVGEVRRQVVAEVQGPRLSGAVSAAVATEFENRDPRLLDEVTRRIQATPREVVHLHVTRRYPFAGWLSLFGGILGAIVGVMLKLRYEKVTLAEAADKSWLVTSLASDNSFAVLFICIVAALGVALGTFIGWLIDIARNRTTEREIARQSARNSIA